MNLTPTPLKDRVDALDFLRGIALLGIFIANMLHFHSPYVYMDPYSWFSAPGEQAAFQFIDIFVEASFYPLFAMLFGYGINMQYEKSLRNETPFAPFMTRRMSWLLVFGIMHALLIWFGDILFTYAVMGFIMIAVVRIPKKWLLSLALILYLVPAGLMYIFLVIGRKAGQNMMMDGFVDIQKIELAISAYAHGTFAEIFMFRLPEWLMYSVTGLITSVFVILPLMMIGAALSKWNVIERIYEMKGKLVVVMIIFISLGVLLKSMPYIDGPKFENTLLVQSTFGGPILMFGYAALFLLLWQIPFLKIVTKPFATIGRMAFTTYILQSVIATLIFYSYGAGLYGKVDIMTGTWLAVGIYFIQLIAAQIWLSKFRMGPLESIWRKLSYGNKFRL